MKESGKIFIICILALSFLLPKDYVHGEKIYTDKIEYLQQLYIKEMSDININNVDRQEKNYSK